MESIVEAELADDLTETDYDEIDEKVDIYEAEVESSDRDDSDTSISSCENKNQNSNLSRYKRKTDRQNWSESNMKKAIEAMQNGEMGGLKASKKFHVPLSTLRRRLKLNDWRKGSLGGFKSTFDKTLEAEIVHEFKDIQSRYFMLTTTDVCTLAYQIAEAKNIKHKFSHTTKRAGSDWVKWFKTRNPSINITAPESKDIEFNKDQTEKYFKALSIVMHENTFQPNQIWNVCEAGLTTFPRRNDKIFDRNISRVMADIIKEQYFTVMCCMSAEGTYTPPALIFPVKTLTEGILNGAPTNSIALCQEKGKVDKDIFIKWMDHFVSFVKCSPDNKVLLILNGHSYHKNLEVLTYAKENGIVMFCLPPNCLYKMQPLDVCFYSTLMTYYNREVTNWLKCNLGTFVSHNEVGQLFNNAYVKVASVRTAQSGFSDTGIWPFNPSVFQESMFEPAA